MSFCSGTAPRAVTDNKVLALQGVRAKGSVPRFHSRFHFVLADGPRQLLAELATGEMSGEIGQFDLSAESTAWEARVFKVLCDADLSCTIPKDWLSVAKGDEVLGWLEVKKHSAALCLAVIRGANHPTSPGLPCTTLLYTPAIPLE